MSINSSPSRSASFFAIIFVFPVTLSCFYIRGEFGRTDWFVKRMYVPKGFFTPPFETRESLQNRLDGMYSSAEVHAVKSEGIFCCVK